MRFLFVGLALAVYTLSLFVIQPSALRADEPAPRLDIYGDPLPQGAVARFGSARLRQEYVDWCVFYPTSDKLVSWSKNEATVRIWEIPSGKLLHTLRRKESYPGGSAVSSDGTRLVVAWIFVRDAQHRDFELVFSTYDAKSLRLTHEASAGAAAPDAVGLFSLCNDDRWALMLSGVRIWDPRTGKLVREHPHADLIGYSKATGAIAVSEKGDEAVKISLVDARSGEVRSQWTVADAFGWPVRPVALSDDGSRIAVRFTSGTSARRLQIYAAATGKLLGAVPSRDLADRHLYFSGQRCLLLAKGAGATPWEVAPIPPKGHPLMGNWEAGAEHRPAVVSPDRRWIVSMLRSVIEVWDSRTWKRTLEGHAADRVDHVALSPDGKLAATVARGSVVQVWRFPEGTPLARYSTETLREWMVAFTADGKSLVSLESRETRYSPPEDRTPFPGTFTHRPGSLTKRLERRLLPDGPAVIRVRDALSGKATKEIDVTEKASRFAFAPGPGLAAVGESDAVYLLDVARERVLRTLRFRYGEGDGRLFFSPLVDVLVVANAGDAGIWDVATGVKLYDLKGQVPASRQLAFSQQAGMMMLSQQDTSQGRVTVTVYELASGLPARTVNIPNASFGAAGWAPNPEVVWTLTGEVIDAVRAEHGFRNWGIREQLARPAERESWVDTDFSAASSDGEHLVTDNQPITVWRTPPEMKPRQGAPQNLSPAEHERLWEILSGEDAAAALTAFFALSQGGDGTVDFLRERLHAAEPVDASVIESLIAALESDEFKIRDAAAQRLLALKSYAEPQLRAALDGTKSLELRNAIPAILGDPSWLLRQNRAEIAGIRAVHVLDAIGSEKARKLIKELAAGCPQHRQTVYANCSLKAAGREPAK